MTEDRFMHAQIRVRHLSLALVVLCGAAVGAVTPAAAQHFTEFPIPTGSSFPQGITAGPDGALWFVEQRSNKIGRITTPRVIFQITIPTAPTQHQANMKPPRRPLLVKQKHVNKKRRLTA